MSIFFGRHCDSDEGLTMNRNIKFDTAVPLVSSEISAHRTFMDTQGRTALTLTAMNLIDETRMMDVVVSILHTQFGTFGGADVLSTDHIRPTLISDPPQTTHHHERLLQHLHRCLARLQSGRSDRRPKACVICPTHISIPHIAVAQKMYQYVLMFD